MLLRDLCSGIFEKPNFEKFLTQPMSLLKNIIVTNIN